MATEVPLRSACSAAIADIKLQPMKDKNGLTRGHFYSAAVPKTCAPGGTSRGRANTSISILPLFAGSLRVAADGDMPTVNAALIRAKLMLADYKGDRAVSCVVRSLALSLLRSGWRPHLGATERRVAEAQAQFDPDVDTQLYIDDEDAAWAAEHNARVAAGE